MTKTEGFGAENISRRASGKAQSLAPTPQAQINFFFCRTPAPNPLKKKNVLWLQKDSLKEPSTQISCILLVSNEKSYAIEVLVALQDAVAFAIDDLKRIQ